LGFDAPHLLKKAAFLWGDPDPDQWSKICLDHVHQRNRWIHSGHGFTGSFDEPWSRQILDHWSGSGSPQRNEALNCQPTGFSEEMVNNLCKLSTLQHPKTLVERDSIKSGRNWRVIFTFRFYRGRVKERLLRKVTRKSIIVSVFRRFLGPFFKEEGSSGWYLGVVESMGHGCRFFFLTAVVFLSPF